MGDTALERGGHFDSVWGYRTEEGLGLLEYFQFAEDLGAEPVWVVNAGISAMQDIPPAAGMGRPGVAVVVTDVLDGLEYLTASPENTTWGSLRAKHGRVEPFRVSIQSGVRSDGLSFAPQPYPNKPLQNEPLLNYQVRYLAIGNEDCHHPYYAANYVQIRTAVKRRYPTMRFIANCDLSKAGALPALAGYTPTPLAADIVDVYDVHFYAPASAFLAARDQYAGCDPAAPKVFLSEYAATCVPPQCTTGTLSNAVAEAAWLVGLERHGDCVELAAYAPLFARREFISWSPDAVIFNSTHAFGTPSYWVSRLFASHRGVRALSAVVGAENEQAAEVDSATADGAASESSLAHSVTLDAARRVIIKLVNIDSTAALPVRVQMDTTAGALGAAAHVATRFASASWEYVSGPSGDSENSMELPEQVSIRSRDISTNLVADGIALTLPPMSVSVVCLVPADHATAASK